MRGERSPDEADVSGAIARRVTRNQPAPSLTMRAVPDPTGSGQWTAGPGDHLWHIAEATLEQAWQRPPTDAEVNKYWKALIDENRAQFVVAGNPDLIHPGQTFTLPAVPPG